MRPFTQLQISAICFELVVFTSSGHMAKTKHLVREGIMLLFLKKKKTVVFFYLPIYNSDKFPA